MRNPGGYFVCLDPDPRRGVEGLVEMDTFSCQHCNRIVRVRAGTPPEDAGGRCMQCGEGLGGLICRECAAKGTCTPLIKAIEAMEEQDYVMKKRGEEIRKEMSSGRFEFTPFGGS